MIGTALRPLGRGLRDTLDHLLPFTLASISWWLGVFLIVTAPAATLALFRFTDPRALEDHRRPTRPEVLELVRSWLGTGWRLGLALAVPVVVLVRNLATHHDLGWLGTFLVPLWVVLLLATLTAGGIACSLVANHGEPVGRALRRAVLLTLSRAPILAPLVLLLWLIVAVGGLLAVPAVAFVPTLVAVTMNHVTYAALGIAVVDPLDPTPERRAEEQRVGGSTYASN